MKNIWMGLIVVALAGCGGPTLPNTIHAATYKVAEKQCTDHGGLIKVLSQNEYDNVSTIAFASYCVDGVVILGRVSKNNEKVVNVGVVK